MRASNVTRRVLESIALTVVCGAMPACVGVTSTPRPTARPEASRSVFPRADVEPDEVGQAVAAERTLATRYDSLPPVGADWFEVVLDTGRVLLVAPHATSQLREGQVKRADAGSGSLALILGRITGSTVIYTTYRSPADPNYYDNNEFKSRLRMLVDSLHPVLVLDLHASHWQRPYDIDFGTIGGESLRGRQDLLLALAQALQGEGLANFSQDRFAAATNQTVTKWIAGMGVPAMQLEINSVWLLHSGADGAQEHRFAQLLQGLVRFVREVRR
jgi:hypothetical protein